MLLPEMPFLPLSSKIRCPVCRGRIASLVVNERFSCHHCDAVLSSNKKAAFRKGIATATLSYLLCAVIVNVAEDLGIKLAVGLLGGLIAVYAGYGVYRWQLKILLARRTSSQKGIF